MGPWELGFARPSLIASSRSSILTPNPTQRVKLLKSVASYIGEHTLIKLVYLKTRGKNNKCARWGAGVKAVTQLKL